MEQFQDTAVLITRFLILLPSHTIQALPPSQISLTDDATQSLSVTQMAAESVHLYLVLTVSPQFIFHCL